MVKTDNNNGLPLPLLVSVAMLLLMAFGGGWSLMQSQFANVNRSMEDRDKALIIQQKKTDHEIELDRAQFTTNYDHVTRQIEEVGNELKARLVDVHNELRHDLVNQFEFKQFEKQVDDLVAQVRLLNAAKPSKDELGATAAALEKRIDALTLRLNNLSDRIEKLH
jgi:hypothetical protein